MGRPPSRVADYVIVGAGITGAAVAAQLTAGGVSTVVLEAGAGPARGATGSSGGMVRAYDPDPAIVRLALPSVTRYADPAAWTSQTAPLHKVGAVTLAAPEHAEAFESAAADLRAAGWPAEVVTGAHEVCGVRTSGAVALLEPSAGWVDPVRVTSLLLDEAMAAGAEVRLGTRVTGLEPSADGTDGADGIDVVTDHGTIRARHGVVLATGAWAARQKLGATDTAGSVRTRSIQTALVRRPSGVDYHCTFIDLRTGGYGKPVDDQTSLIGYPLLDWDVDPDAAMPPDDAHRARTVDVVAENLPWLQDAADVTAIRSMDAFSSDGNGSLDNTDTHQALVTLVATGMSGVWLCRSGNGGGVRVAPELGRQIARTLTIRRRRNGALP